MARAAFLSVVLTILLKLMNYQHRKVLPNLNPPCNTRWKASAMIPKAHMDRKTHLSISEAAWIILQRTEQKAETEGTRVERVQAV